MLALPIFPARLQASIFGRSELNFRVRNGNGWTLALINTNFNFLRFVSLTQISNQRSVWNLKRENSGGSELSCLHGSEQSIACFRVVTRTGIEPMFAAWEAAVLTAWPTGQMVRLQGFEPGTHWLRVSCSTNWAKGAYFLSEKESTQRKLNSFFPTYLLVQKWGRFLHPENRTVKQTFLRLQAPAYFFIAFVGQALGLLVSVSSMPHSTSTSDLSTT